MMESTILSDAVFAKLQESVSVEEEQKVIDDKIVDVYSKVGVMLSRYRSGKIPKAFKIIPRLKNWGAILDLTRPDEWTPNATYQATKIFVSGLSPKLAEYFLRTILLPKIRQDISHNKKLNSHYYESLKKALYKPAAFFRGIVLAMCKEEDATLKEATIIGSILAKMSIPVLHSAAALLKVSEMEYSGTRSIFIKTLLDKKYALPERVISGMVDYFGRFTDYEGEDSLPVLWHQSLLIFAQRYKDNITGEQRERLMHLLTEQHHDQISAEISRELEVGTNLVPMQI